MARLGSRRKKTHGRAHSAASRGPPTAQAKKQRKGHVPIDSWSPSRSLIAGQARLLRVGAQQAAVRANILEIHGPGTSRSFSVSSAAVVAGDQHAVGNLPSCDGTGVCSSVSDMDRGNITPVSFLLRWPFCFARGWFAALLVLWWDGWACMPRKLILSFIKHGTPFPTIRIWQPLGW